jgi:O-methyltransferase
MDITTKFDDLASLSGFLCRPRKLNIVRAVMNTAHVDGSIIEIGCNGGGTSVIIQFLIEAMKLSKEFHVYDSFAGLNGKCDKDDGKSAESDEFCNGRWVIHEEHLLRTFHSLDLKPPIIHAGLIQNMTPADFPEKVSMAFFDVDFYMPTLAALVLVWPRIVEGGILVIDDYGFEPLPGVKVAVEEYFGDEVQIDTSTSITAVIKKSA